MSQKSYFAAAVLGIATCASAKAETVSYVDVDGSVGYATNPLLSLADDNDSFFVRVAANAVHSWTSERTSLDLIGFVENSSYFSQNRSTQIFDAGAKLSHKLTEKVSIAGGAGLRGDFGGQLRGRFIGNPLPLEPEIGAPLPSPDLDLIAFTGRSYRLRGSLSGTIAPSLRDTIGLSAEVQHVFFSGASSPSDHMVYSAAGSYDRKLSERTTLGFRLQAQHSSFVEGGSTTVLTPQVTVRQRLSEQWEATGAVGISHSSSTFTSSTKTTSLSLEASACRLLEYSRFCARVSRIGQPSAFGDIVISNELSADYYRRIGPKQTVQISGSAARHTRTNAFSEDQNSTFISAAAAFNQKFTDRLSVGVNLGVRTLRQVGLDPRADVNGSAFLRYRIGDLR